MKLKALLSTALTALALGSATPADARNTSPYVNLTSTGYWTSYFARADNTGTPLCGMRTAGQDSSIMVKKFADDKDYYFQIVKSTWRFPKEGVTVPLTVLIDGHFVGSVEARGVTWITPNGAAMPKVEFSMTPEQWSEFLHDFAEANEMTVQFNSGNEGSWTAKMVGSRDAAKGFWFCIDYVEKRSTQPYAATPPTQPYQQPDNTVTPKQVKPTRETVKKKDDGSI